MMVGPSLADPRRHAEGASERSLLALGMSAMVAFVLLDAATRVGWVDASFGLGGSALAVIVYVATLVRAHLDGAR